MNKIRVIFGLCMIIALGLYGADKVSRFAGQTLNQGGTTTTNGKTVIESNSPTNAFRVLNITATVAGSEAYTNTFATPFLSTPTVVQGIASGQNSGYGSAGVVTISTTKVIITLLETGVTNGVPYLIYGTVRTGVFE